MRTEGFVGWGLLMLGFVGWLLTADLGWIQVPDGALFGGGKVHGALLLAPGLLLGLGLTFLQSVGRRPEDTAALDLATARVLFAATVIAAAGALMWGVTREHLDPLRAVLVLICGVVALTVAFAVVRRLSEPGAAVTFDNHWGGLGGGLGGWRVSGLGVLVVLLVIFASGTISVGVWDPKHKDEPPPPPTDPAQPSNPVNNAGASANSTNGAQTDAGAGNTQSRSQSSGGTSSSGAPNETKAPPPPPGQRPAGPGGLLAGPPR